jgi:hypothetical protein
MMAERDIRGLNADRRRVSRQRRLSALAVRRNWQDDKFSSELTTGDRRSPASPSALA